MHLSARITSSSFFPFSFRDIWLPILWAPLRSRSSDDLFQHEVVSSLEAAHCTRSQLISGCPRESILGQRFQCYETSGFPRNLPWSPCSCTLWIAMADYWWRHYLSFKLRLDFLQGNTSQLDWRKWTKSLINYWLPLPELLNLWLERCWMMRTLAIVLIDSDLHSCHSLSQEGRNLICSNTLHMRVNITETSYLLFFIINKSTEHFSLSPQSMRIDFAASLIGGSVWILHTRRLLNPREDTWGLSGLLNFHA